MKTKIFIDFDNTLYDTRFLKKDLFEVLQSQGFSKEEVLAAYKKATSNYNYSPTNHLEELLKIKSFNTKATAAIIESLYLDAPEHLFKDSVSFLKSLDRKKFEVDLLTLGDTDFQKRKVEASGITKYFDNIYYCEEQKWIFLKTLVKPNERFYVIDDRGDALFEISKDFKLCYTIEINRTAEPLDSMEKPSPYSGVSVVNFKEAIPFLIGGKYA
ncbi:MAG: HAD hydrolase-like protein [Patescibacteria group bacterium]|nr:HAD hydrolase-like protein [Patescibacteria group bacterium]